MNDYYSEEINEISEALCSFQGQLKTIEKDKSVNIRTKSGYNIKYNYADLATIMSQIRKPLKDSGLCVSHSIQQSDNQMKILVTTLFHKSGQYLRSSMPIEHTQDEKSLGAKITYYRRYALGSLLGIVTDDDVDADLQGGEQEGNIAKPVVEKAEAFTKEAQEILHAERKTPHFYEYIDLISKKCNLTREGVLNRAAENKDSFYEAFKVFERQKKAS